jgi:hypothetical protein
LTGRAEREITEAHRQRKSVTALSGQGKRAVAGQVLGEVGPVTRACNRLGPTCHAQLAEQVADVLLDRRQRDHQFAGDLLVGGAGNEQAQDLLFTAGERLHQR